MGIWLDLVEKYLEERIKRTETLGREEEGVETNERLFAEFLAGNIRELPKKRKKSELNSAERNFIDKIEGSPRLAHINKKGIIATF